MSHADQHDLPRLIRVITCEYNTHIVFHAYMKNYIPDPHTHPFSDGFVSDRTKF